MVKEKEYVVIKEEASEMFSHTGAEAKGRHIISIFTKQSELEEVSGEYPNLTYKTFGAALKLPANYVVELGGYSSSLIWTSEASI